MTNLLSHYRLQENGCIDIMLLQHGNKIMLHNYSGINSNQEKEERCLSEIQILSSRILSTNSYFVDDTLGNFAWQRQ